MLGIMTEKETQALLALANGWEEAANGFERSKRRYSSLADYWQKRGDFKQRDLCRLSAAHDEIRASVYRSNAKLLAIKVGELVVKPAGNPVKKKRFNYA